MNYQTIFTKAYSGKKVLLTGHTGFKGSWMLAWLHQLGADVKGYSLAPEHSNGLYTLIDGESLGDQVIADIRDAGLVKKTVMEFQPDFIFHMAAQPLVRQSYDEPVYTFEVNVTGTANVLDSLRFLDKPCTAVMITTDKVYENREQHYHYRESDRLGGYDPYSASKAAAEIVINSYRSSFFNTADQNRHHKAIASARAGNVIGGGDRAKDRIIPDIIRGLEAGQTITVRNPHAVRPWQHVLEPVAGYLLLGAKMAGAPIAFADAWNFGPDNNDTLTVSEVVEKALAIWGTGGYETPLLSGQPHEAGLLKLDITKTVRELQWLPKFNSSKAIEETINWYRQVNKDNAAAYTFAQIDQYQQL